MPGQPRIFCPGTISAINAMAAYQASPHGVLDKPEARPEDHRPQGRSTPSQYEERRIEPTILENDISLYLEAARAKVSSVIPKEINGRFSTGRVLGRSFCEGAKDIKR